MFQILDTGASALQAQRTRLDTIAENIANVNTTKGPHGENAPFRRRLVEFAAGNGAGRPGVHVAAVRKDASAFAKRYEPGNPARDADDMVAYPNIDPTVEFVNALDASRAYEANVTMMETAKSMISSSLRLLA